MMTDEQIIAEQARARKLAADLAIYGGECDCRPCGPDGPQQARYDILRVELRSGRVFTGTTIHGHGGLHRVYSDNLDARERMLDRVQRQLASEPGRPVTIYLVERFFGSETFSVHPTEIASVELDDLGSANLRRERWSREQP